MEFTAEHRLATYGTLAPGEVNADQLDGLQGEWKQGTIRGDLLKEGWGADHGCPGCLINPNGERIDVFIFESADLPRHWARLDAFEGTEYSRIETMAETKDGLLEVSIYELNREELSL
ncbi:MAG: gamma-glutamylcyclotransferase family protein [Rhizobiaceae bacterium]|nr:gamma-glutamylcyclotransferase family protein [Rhizobiaceae bacterium]